MGRVGAACKVSLNGHRKQKHFILPIVLVLFGVRETHHGFSPEQLLHDPGQLRKQYQRLIFTKFKITCYWPPQCSMTAY